MESFEGANVTRSSPAKRSFDVAFLTGRDLSSPAHPTPSKLTRLSENHNPVSSQTTSSPPGSPKASSHSSVSAQPPSTTPGSAFTKVTRSLAASPPLSTTSTTSFDTSSSIGSSWPPVSASFSAMTSLLGTNKSLAPLLSNHGLLNPSLAPLLSPATPDRLNNNLVEEYLKTQQQFFSSSKMMANDLSSREALTRLRSSIYPSDPYKLPFSSMNYPLIGSTSPSGSESTNSSKISPSSPFLSQNHVPSLIPPTFSLAAQNVCAKCNISFRMTSDLVYHMRSQHKKEPDPYKRRRNEKLKCPICAESFRERHHLTRHMTAHQDREEEIAASK